jgi:predicted O-methyltransferase YrrM
MLAQTLKQAARRVTPDWAAEWIQERRLPHQVELLMKRAEGCRSPEAMFELLGEFPDFVAQQFPREIAGLLRIVEGLAPSRMIEIGSYRGGTVFLFARYCQPDARILSLDWRYRPGRKGAIPRFAAPGQTIQCVEGDSHSTAVRDKAAEYFHGELVDFLFIDGDHSYQGVKADFEMYSPMVRPGGVIAFHDINPDFAMTRGQRVNADSGEVPRFWLELKARYPEAYELIHFDNPADQDGAGIGVLPWNGS